MHEYDYDYDSRRKGPNFPLYSVHKAESLCGIGMPLFWIVLGTILFSLVGC